MNYKHKKKLPLSRHDKILFTVCMALFVLIVFGFGVSYAASDRAGDANGDGACNVGDAVYILSYVFKAGPPPVPIEYATAAQVDSLHQKLDIFMDMWAHNQSAERSNSRYSKYPVGPVLEIGP